MGDPADPEFERKIRRQIHANYKLKAAQNADLYKRLMEAQAKIRMLELLLENQRELVELADSVVRDGTPEEKVSASE